MNIRPFQAGDEFAQLKIYNTAAAAQVKFKPAVSVDIQRRITAKDFDPQTRLYAEEQGSVVGYCTWQTNGRIGYPWCLPGKEEAAELLFDRTLQAMKAHGIRKAFCAYRKDWPAINGFFQKHGFVLAREMVNFIMPFENMPTPSARQGSAVTPMEERDIPGVYALDPSVFRAQDTDALKSAIWNNPWYGRESLFVLRDSAGKPQAGGVFITNMNYADPKAVDSSMPCFRLGAFGTEGMTTKRVCGLFSFVARPDRSIFANGMELMSYATRMLQDDDEVSCFAAHVASDATALCAFYQRTFDKQGSFPVCEKDLTK